MQCALIVEHVIFYVYILIKSITGLLVMSSNIINKLTNHIRYVAQWWSVYKADTNQIGML